MNKILTIFLFCYTLSSFSQEKIIAEVVSLVTGDVISNCNVIDPISGQGTITNKDGLFVMWINKTVDSLLISHIQYESLMISVNDIRNKQLVYLNPHINQLDEVVVGISDKEIYNTIKKIRKNIKSDNKDLISKLYYLIESKSDGNPVEILECYYNAYINGIQINELKFKNGRASLSSNEKDNYYLSLHSSRAFVYFPLVNKNNYIPYQPLQLKFKDNLKYFNFVQINIHENLSKIIFTTREKYSDIAFNGSIFYNPIDFKIRQIELVCNNLEKHPFLPIVYTDSISNVNISYIANYYNDKLNFIEANYDFKYFSERDSSLFVVKEKKINHCIESNVFLYCYDYNNKFIEPYFEFDNNYWDYYKMSIIPYNSFFWNNCYYFPLSKDQESMLDEIKNKGNLKDYYDWGNSKKTLASEIYSKNTEEKTIFSSYYIFWERGKAIKITNFENSQEVDKLTLAQSYKSDLFNLEVQILLDINDYNNKLNVKSYTIFDISKTYFNLPRDSITDDFATCYFNICEIERRKMQREIDKNNYTIKQVDSLYNITNIKMNDITTRYLKEVDVGLNEKQMDKWKDYVKDYLD